MKSVLKETINKWDPNFPLDVTHEKFVEHVNNIEKKMGAGDCYTVDEFMEKWKIWEQNYLKSKGEK